MPEVILTLGSNGSFVVTEHAVEHAPAKEITGPVDPTGARDTFAAGYLTARAGGAEPVEAARVGADEVAAFLAGA